MNQTDSVIAKIVRVNAGRDPERLRMKYAKMASSPFVFLRGACHLFYDALPDVPALRQAPPAWCCGDLHFENFGSYKGDNRQVYFDINDYDEAALAPCTWDIVRLLVSIRSGAEALRASAAEAEQVGRVCVSRYRDDLLRGKPMWVERETSSGLVNKLLESLRYQERAAFLDRRTIRKGHRRELNTDGVKALSASAEQRDKVTAFMAAYAASQKNPDFFRVLDVARRIAGTGSLGVERYVVLVEGKGAPDGCYLIDLKEAKPSALIPHLTAMGMDQPVWESQAERVVTIQKRMQAVDHAFLEAVELDGASCILKGLQPSEDRVDIAAWGHKLERLEDVVGLMGSILAWDQLRAAGRGGAACADELADFAAGGNWENTLFEVAGEMTELTRNQWQAFTAARQAGLLET
ncbi:MAG: DUF2252 domain-containing protein [Sulfuricella sp.]|nr:DUF2252 domain-containing protein [Sulfuricella sp.]